VPITICTKLPPHDGATFRIEPDFKAEAAIRLPQLGERGLLGHILRRHSAGTETYD